MGKTHKATIEINGKRYDVVTGALLDAPAIPTVKAVKPSAGKVMDVQRPAAHHVKPHTPERAKTLVRSAVHKPAPSPKRQLKAQTHTGLLAKAPSVVVAPKVSVQQVDPTRLQHAKHVSKSELIQRFATQASADIVAPQTAPTHSQPHHPIVTTTPKTSANDKQSLDIFERAIAKATAHEEPPFNPRKHARHLRKQARHLKHQTKPVHHRTPSLLAASLAVLVLCAFVAWQNKPGLTLRYANAKAGFSANLPSFRPSGFAFSSFSYAPGSVGISFQNSLTHRGFKLQEQPSNWDSQTLLVNQVASNNHSYQTLSVGGRTIYIWGNNNASWVDSGVLYNLTSNGSLSTNDVLNVASSI